MLPTEKYPSQVLQDAVEAISSLPGVGSRSALRLALHLLKQPSENIHHFAAAVDRLADEVHYCKTCRMIADSDECSICADRSRDHATICVVESIRDVMSIEATGQYHGTYHVLGGIISPINGIGPSDLSIRELVERLRAMSPPAAAGSAGAAGAASASAAGASCASAVAGASCASAAAAVPSASATAGASSDGPAPGVPEVILALSGDVEGETTAFYIYRQIESLGVKVTTLARGLGFGDDLEYADSLTLGRSLTSRQPFKP